MYYFRILAEFILNKLCLPISSAFAEGAFSQVSLAKTTDGPQILKENMLMIRSHLMLNNSCCKDLTWWCGINDWNLKGIMNICMVHRQAEYVLISICFHLTLCFIYCSYLPSAVIYDNWAGFVRPYFWLKEIKFFSSLIPVYLLSVCLYGKFYILLPYKHAFLWNPSLS